MTDKEHSWLTGRVLRAARVLSGLAAADIAKMAGVGEATIKRAEAADSAPRMTHANLTAVRAAYRDLGIHIEAVANTRQLIIRFPAHSQ